jgi:hypothetical protein
MVMTDKATDEGIRLMSVMEISGVQEREFKDYLLEQAAQDKISIYVAVPPGKSVYSDSLGVAPRAPRSLTNTYALTRDRINNTPVIASPVVRHDIIFLKLGRSDVEALAAKAHADVHWFSAALAKHPDETKARRGYVVYPRGLLWTFCLRAPATCGSNWRYTQPMRFDTENIYRFRFSDLYLSDEDATSLQPSTIGNGQINEKESFTKLTSGVRLLCLAARAFYEHPAPGSGPKHSQIAEWLASHTPDNDAVRSQSASRALFNQETSERLASFVNPTHDRNKGQLRRALDQEVILSVRKRYPQTFVSSPLRALIHLDEWWQSSHREGRTLPGGIKEFDEKMCSIGFVGKHERKAIARLFYWPNALPAHKWIESSGEASPSKGS